jgi:hypothetical protein
VVDAAGEVFGGAPNVAARAQSAAEPGTVLVTATVQRQTAGLFVSEDKGAHALKGVPQPVALFRIVRASGGGRRSGARALTPLVGREDELALLQRRWSCALEGEGQFVKIVGEPGIGESRLIEEFHGKLADTPHTWIEWAASQLLQNTPLHPAIPAASLARRQSSSRSKAIRESLPRFNSLGDRSSSATPRRSASNAHAE